MKKNFSEEILNKIKKEKIKQIPRHVFILKHAIVWFFLFLSVLVWAISLSITFEYIINADWFLIHRLWIIQIAITFLPIFWLIFLLLASFLSYYNFKHTEKWYKYNFLKILWINIFLSVIFWVLIYTSGANYLIEWSLEKYIPRYRWILVENKESRMIKVWQNEDSGLIIWEILKINDDNLEFIDYNNKNWLILISKNTNIKWRVSLNIWEKIKIIWEKTDDNIFEAIEIRPFNWRWNK